MIERAALGQIRRRISELSAEREELRQLVVDYGELVAKIDGHLADGGVVSAGFDVMTAVTEPSNPARGQPDMSGLRRAYQAVLHPDLVVGNDRSGAGDLSVRLNSAIDAGDALAAADVLNGLAASLGDRSDLASMVVRMFALNDEVTLLRALAQSQADSPLEDLRNAFLDDPDLDLGAFFRMD